MVVVRDITLQNDIENKAMLNDKMATVGTLMAGVAHEVNNPLTYVLGNLAFLKEHFNELKLHLRLKGIPDELDMKFFADILEELSETTKGSERIRDIVGGLKSFVRADKGEMEKIDLNETVRNAVKMVSHELRNRALLVEDYAAGLPILTANSGRLQQVFINLLINASQSIEAGLPEDNKIVVRTGQKDGVLFAEFSDTGRGISKDVLPKIFEPFFTTKPAGVGTGLGLAICKEILRQHHGAIEVQSKVGQGSTFTIRLPLENGRKSAVASSEVSAAVRS
jgi:signal transduction histidine kinase